VPFSGFHINALYAILLFSFWLTSLREADARCIHLIATDLNLILLMAEQYSIVYIYHNFCVYSSVSGSWGGCFHVLAILNSTAINNAVRESFHTWLSQCVCPIVGLLTHRVVLFLVLKGLSILFSIVAISIYIPPQSARGFSFLHDTSSLIVSRFFYDNLSGKCEVMHNCSFGLHFFHNEWWTSCLVSLCSFLKNRFRITENLADSVQSLIVPVSSYRASLFLYLASSVINIVD